MISKQCVKALKLGVSEIGRLFVRLLVFENPCFFGFMELVEKGKTGIASSITRNNEHWLLLQSRITMVPIRAIAKDKVVY